MQSVNAAKKWKLHIPNHRWNSQNVWREQRPRTSTFIRDRPERGEEQENLPGEPEGHSSPTPHDEEAKSDFWTIIREFIYRHHVEPRVKLCRGKNHFLFR